MVFDIVYSPIHIVRMEVVPERIEIDRNNFFKVKAYIGCVFILCRCLRATAVHRVYLVIKSLVALSSEGSVACTFIEDAPHYYGGVIIVVFYHFLNAVKALGNEVRVFHLL